jgi:hypothetical protein
LLHINFFPAFKANLACSLSSLAVFVDPTPDDKTAAAAAPDEGPNIDDDLIKFPPKIDCESLVKLPDLPVLFICVLIVLWLL